MIEFVNRYTRAGKSGKKIHCPHCNEETLVGHFSWSALKCKYCRKFPLKYEWKIIKGDK